MSLPAPERAETRQQTTKDTPLCFRIQKSPNFEAARDFGQGGWRLGGDCGVLQVGRTEAFTWLVIGSCSYASVSRTLTAAPQLPALSPSPPPAPPSPTCSICQLSLQPPPSLAAPGPSHSSTVTLSCSPPAFPVLPAPHTALPAPLLLFQSWFPLPQSPRYVAVLLLGAAQYIHSCWWPNGFDPKPPRATSWSIVSLPLLELLPTPSLACWDVGGYGDCSMWTRTMFSL